MPAFAFPSARPLRASHPLPAASPPLRHHHQPRTSPRTPTKASLPPASPANPPHTFEGVTWPEVEQMCGDIAAAAAADRFDVVLGVTRGGMVPATLLCEALRLRNMLSATVMFYTDAGDQFFGMTEPRFLAFPSADALEGRRVLVVDDVWDSGRTAHAVKKRVERARPEMVKVAVLHFKPGLNVFQGLEPDFYCVTTENWVLYPWEHSSPDAPAVDIPQVEAPRVGADQESTPFTGNG